MAGTTSSKQKPDEDESRRTTHMLYIDICETDMIRYERGEKCSFIYDAGGSGAGALLRRLDSGNVNDGYGDTHTHIHIHRHTYTNHKLCAAAETRTPVNVCTEPKQWQQLTWPEARISNIRLGWGATPLNSTQIHP